MVATLSLREIKKEFRALGWLTRNSRAQALFSSELPLEGSNIRRNTWAEAINTWLHGQCHCQNFWFFDNGMIRAAPGIMSSDRTHLSQQEGKVFAQTSAKIIVRALN